MFSRMAKVAADIYYVVSTCFLSLNLTPGEQKEACQRTQPLSAPCELLRPIWLMDRHCLFPIPAPPLGQPVYPANSPADTDFKNKVISQNPLGKHQKTKCRETVSFLRLHDFSILGTRLSLRPLSPGHALWRPGR